jgi:acetate kinase
MRVLTVNPGSSSLKAALFDVGSTETLEAAASVERIGSPPSVLRVTRPDGVASEQGVDVTDYPAALRAVLASLPVDRDGAPLSAVAHRVVSGGRHVDPQLVTSDLVEALRALVSLDPDHLPQTLQALQALSDAYPALPQVACFDTWFHRVLPHVAQLYPLPRRFRDVGVRRYGFHGLSCEFVMGELAVLDPSAAAGRVIIAHLGNGASLTAVRQRASLETTMGFSPTGGLMMGTRAGDLDPGVLLYLLQTQGLTAAGVNHVVNEESGLLGVSETSADMQDLLRREPSDPRAADAIALFCHLARKSLGALVAALGGLETLVFVGGIGERAAGIRARICAGLTCFGLELDEHRNAQHAPVVSPDGSPVVIRVIHTDEDRMLARHAHRLLARGDASGDV